MSEGLSVCIIAGEASGDLLGARLMEAIRQEAGKPVIFCGVGGAMMEAQGLQSLFPMRDLSVMGVAEVLPRLPLLLKRIKQTVAFVLEKNPDVVVTIDSPDFCFRVAEKVRRKAKKPPRMIHYVAPTVWAWRPERAAKVARLYDGILCLFPFEPHWFEKEGMEAVFVGHPVMEAYRPGGGDALRRHLGIPEKAQVLGLLFGSRNGELNRTGPVLRQAAALVAEGRDDLHILSLTLPHLEAQVRNLLEEMGVPVHVVSDADRKWDCFDAMDFAMATSGTVGLELAVAGVPHLIAYRTSWLTAQIVRSRITVSYAHLANILLNRPAVPEFIQENCSAYRLAESAESLTLTWRSAQLAAFEDVWKMLRPQTDEPPSVLAARFVLGEPGVSLDRDDPSIINAL